MLKPGETVEQQIGSEEDDEDNCGICQVAFEGCCPECRRPGDDCPLSKFPLLCLAAFNARGTEQRVDSLWRMLSYIPHALSPQVAQHRIKQELVSSRPQSEPLPTQRSGWDSSEQ